MTEFANQQALVTTDWIAGQLDQGIKLVEVDEDTEAYASGHIRGAVMLNWVTDMQDQTERQLVDKKGFEELLGSRGISENDTVVLYGGNNNWFAAYAYWLFKLYGHADVRLMDGGRKKWELEDRELLTGAPPVAPATYRAQGPDTSIRAHRDEVIAAVRRLPMVDVRSTDEFIGRIAAPPHLPHETGQRKGHIPGATSIPWSRAANDDGSFKSADELAAIYMGECGLSADKETVTYCRIGERSSHTWFVLRELLGFPSVKNYDGSWTEYGSLVGVPIERTYWEDE
ncbi:MAG: thiosulfate/3-mercaptopyruvate sulfurtransferase [Chloroflexota bacterium]|jgi:thiosulfate/3-mercaptopyruvate sulfurtransferase|nr:thiosulfate/3-mercaptopyruvate sulfurtransferase [Chloroflexota bacterium]